MEIFHIGEVVFPGQFEEKQMIREFCNVGIKLRHPSTNPPTRHTPVAGKIVKISGPGRERRWLRFDVFITFVNYEQPRLARYHQVID